MKSLRETMIRVCLLLLGLVIAHLGVTLFLLSDLGSDPFNVLVQGLFRTLQRTTGLSFLTHGRVHIFVSVLIALALLVIDRSYVRIGTLLCMLLGGPIIDGFSLLLRPLFAALPGMAPRLVILALGCVILAFGMTIVIRSEAGTGPNDLVAVVLSDKLGTRFSLTRVAVDVLFVLVGWLLGGIFGVGTLICAFLVGPAAGFFMPRSEKIVQAALRRWMK